jgi:RND family efflux transporter MFP subunit
MRSPKLQWCIGVAMALAMGCVACVALMAQHARDAAVPRRARQERLPLPVRTVAVMQQEYIQSIGATAVTVPSETACIWINTGSALRDTGVRVKAVHVAEGAEVQQGQLLFELDDQLFVQSVKRQEAALAAAQADLDSVLQLRRDQAATGPQLRNAELQFELAQLELQVAQRDLQLCTVRSPIHGFADVIAVARGEEVDVGREVTRIHNLDPIHLRVDFPQERLDDVFIGQAAEVVLDSFPQEIFPAQVIRIAPQADPETRVLPVVLEMANSSHRIRAGLTGFVRLRVHCKSFVIPKTAVITRGTQAMVFRITNGHAEIQGIKIGPEVEIGSVQVLEGLTPGDEVVVYGGEYLRGGDVVNDDWHRWAGRE